MDTAAPQRRLVALCAQIGRVERGTDADRLRVRAGLEGGPPLVSHHPEDDPAGSAGLGLTQAEASFFREKGFLVKRALVPAETLAPWVEKFWAELPESAQISPADRASWVDPGRRWEVSEQPARTPDGKPTQRGWPCNYTSTGNLHNYALGSDSDWLAATSAHPAVLRVVESILGGQIKIPNRNRGTYSYFPQTELGSLGPHQDSLPFDLFGMLYLAEVGPLSGGTVVWPGASVALLLMHA